MLNLSRIRQNNIESLPPYERFLINDLIDKIEKDRDFINERLISLFKELIKVKKIILVARQAVPIGYSLLAMFEILNIKDKEISIITTSSNSMDLDSNKIPTILPEEKESIASKILGSSNYGEKVFIDEICSQGLTETRLLSLAKQLDPKSNYRFISFYNNNRQLVVPWDPPIESIGEVDPNSSMFLSTSEFLSLSQGRFQKATMYSEANIMVPITNYNSYSIIMSSLIANRMYEIGLDAAKRFLREI